MLLLNICFTSIIPIVEDDNKPLAVMGRFYAKAFKLLSDAVEVVIAKEQSEVQDENETAIPQCDAEIKVEHHFGTTFYVTEGSQQFTTTLSKCSCGEKNCRHIQAVNKHREGALRITLPVRVKCDGVRRLLSESTSNRKYYV